ncbi:outer membrane protein assembly factor BamB family protein [Niabella terrae]
MRRFLWLAISLTIGGLLHAQPAFEFAHISDLHVGSATGATDLRLTVADINKDTAIQFVIASGDITEFGADLELELAKQILDSLNKPWYIIPGNHDDNWSESGANSFNRIFGADVFSFEYGGYYFLGANCGPNMKMSPGQVPYENIVWLDSMLLTIPKEAPLIFVDHYPLDSGLNNWYELADRLKKRNIQLYLCGHGHQNQQLNFEGIPAIMGRSNLRAKDTLGGYNVVRIENGELTYRQRRPTEAAGPVWARIPLVDHQFKTANHQWPRPSYAINDRYPQVIEKGRIQLPSDIGNGFVLSGTRIITPNTQGLVQAIDLKTAKPVWRFRSHGKIYATPALARGRVLIASTDGFVYCLNESDGQLLWKYGTDKAIVATPVIEGSKVLLGSSEGIFRCLDLITGELVWQYDQVNNFVKTSPLVYQGGVIFGSWGNELYCLDLESGRPRWVYQDGYSNRMLSPASCTPVGIKGRIFIVAPDRYMTALDSRTGQLIWKKRWPEHWVRESMGLSNDGKLVFAKCMQGHLIGVSTVSDTARIEWQTENVFNYELNPSRIVEHKGKVYAMSDKGVVAAFDRRTGQTLWIHKLANCLVQDLQFLSDKQMVVTTMDGKIVVLQIP